MRVIVAGAGVTGYQIIKMLVANKHDVVVIDKDRETCEMVYTETGAVIVHGSATDIRVLDRAGARNADVVVCLIRNDADNIATAILAKSLGVPSIIALLRKPDYEEAYRSVGVSTIISLTDILTHQILMEVEQPRVKKILTIGGGKAEIYAIEIPPDATSVGQTVKEIAQRKRFPKDCVFMGIFNEKEGRFTIPRGDDRLSKYDTVFLISNSQNITVVADLLTRFT
ncbi:MAG: TrkA family potassium uptake protein [Syntrophobacteraceae bacterium]